tara:strand:+ start:815 stop:1258 length:444 start_codon:yes stop_codon:yes gene_type:complete
MLNPTNIFFILAIVVSRFLPHPPNFTPVIAIFMLSGGLSLLPLLITYLLTDAVLGFHSYMIWVYASLFAVSYLQKGPIISSILFFVITNFAVWTSGYYGFNLQGLLMCYTMAIPFFVNTLLSTMLFYHLIRYYQNNTLMFPRLLTTA